jgi:zinc transporter ZupT
MRPSSLPRSIGLALLPLGLLGLLLAAIVGSRPERAFGRAAPPVEDLAFQRVVLGPEGIEVHVVNNGPDPVEIAQVIVDEAYWSFEQEPARPLGHLERARIRIPYPWVKGEAHEVKLLSSTGLTFAHTIEVALETPRPGLRDLALFALVGTYVGVIPVVLGLLWYPLLGRLPRKAADFTIALTVGLLLFLLVESLREGFEEASRIASSFQGVALLSFSALFGFLAIEGLGVWLRRRWTGLGAPRALALLVSVGIGLHNFAEGLAIGAAFALGRAALGTLLIVGFTLHNTTEGLAIVAPLARQRAPLSLLAALGLVAGGPTIPGAWLGGFLFSPLLAVAALGAGAGAIGQVLVAIVRSSVGERSVGEAARSGAVAGGLAAGAAVMYLTGMIVG